MRIAIVADSHFDEHSRFQECIRLHTWIADDARARGVDVVLHAGDVFERKSTPAERNAFAAWVTRVASFAPMVIVRGNHDAVDDLQIFGGLETANPVIIEENAGMHPISTENGNAHIACLAWPRKAALVASGEFGDDEGAAGRALRAILSGFRDELESAERVMARHTDGTDRFPRILLTHAMVRGSVTSVGQPLVGCDMELGLEDLALAGADLIALGHIHMPQDWDVAGVPAVYPGSPRRTAFGEVEDKGYVVATFDGPKLVGWERVVAPAAPMVLVDVRLRPDGSFDVPEHAPVSGGEVRVRVHGGASQRDAIRDATTHLAQRFRDEGAIEVKAEEAVIAEVRSRMPEIAAARTLDDKLPAFWRAKGIEIEPVRAARLVSLARTLPVGGSANVGGTLRFDGVRARNMGVFKELDIDVAAITGKLVAVTGEIGAGKSTFLELLCGGVYRSCPTRGTLASLASARDSSLEVRVTNGSPWTVRHKIDGISGKGEALLLRGDGTPELPDTKVKAYDQWVEQHLPSPEVLYVSTVAVQRGQGFLGLKAADRKAVLLRVLGVEQLEVQSVEARERAKAPRLAVATLDARIADERSRAVEVEAAQKLVASASESVGAAALALEARQAELRTWEAERIALEAAQVEAKASEAKAASLRTVVAAEEATVADLTTRLANNRRALAQAEQVRAAVARRAEIVAHLTALELAVVAAEGACREATATSNAASAAFAAAERAVREASARVDEAKRREAEARGRLAEREEVNKAADDAVACLLARDAARVAVEKNEHALEELRGQRVVGAEGRVKSLRDGLIEIAGPALNPQNVASATLMRDDEVVDLARSLPGRTKEAEAALLASKQGLSKIEAELARLQRIASRAQLIERAEQDLVAAERDAAAAAAAVEPLVTAAKEAKADFEAAVGVVAARKDAGSAERAEIASLRAESDGLAKLASLLPAVEQASSRIEDLVPQVAAAEARVLAAQGELAAVPTPAKLAAFPPRPDVSAEERGLLEARRVATLAQSTVERAIESAARLAKLAAERAAAFEQLEDWSLLADSFGRDGLQASEIDEAAGQLTATINDLLHTAFGTRWTVTIETQRASSDGKKLLEGLEVRVLDTQEGREGLAETLSGGQSVLVGEAVSLALAMLAAGRSGIRGATIVRDETGSHLSVGVAREYVAMLRRAAEIVGASHVLFVSHVPEIAELADARIHVENGKAAVQ